MLPKRSRLSAEEVREVLAKGSGRRGRILSLKIVSGGAPFRSAVVISKKVAKTAVTRNRVRRAVYSVLQRVSLPPTGRAILFVQSIPKEGLAAAITEDIKHLLHV